MYYICIIIKNNGPGRFPETIKVKEMEYIGKSNKFYTLWEVTIESRTTNRGERYHVTTHQYIKNISFDLNTAKSKYPNAPNFTKLRLPTRE